MQNLLEKLGLGERATSMVAWVGLSLLLLIIVVALAVWLVRTLRPTLNLSGGSARGGRPQRLAITDAFTLDRDGRKLVIVRRDNVEHLLLIGGPNDVLVESSIVRGERSTRDRSGRGGADSDLLAAENALTDAPAAPVAPQAPMVAPPPAPVAPPVFRPAPPPVTKPVQPAAAPRLDDDFERALSAMQNAQRQQAAASPPPAPPRPPQPAPAPFTQPPAPIPAPIPAAPVQPAPMPAPPPPAMAEPVPMPPPPPPLPEPPARSQPVSEMARRLNEVLQKPLSGTLRPPFNKPIPPVPGTMNSAPKPVTPPAPPPHVADEIPLAPPAPPPVPQAPAPAAPVPAAGKPGSDQEMDLLEEEMARLLGRPSQPKKPDAP